MGKYIRAVDPAPKPDKPWLFKKGQSGNPSGRPKKAAALAIKVQSIDDEIVDMLFEIIRSKGPTAASRKDKMEAAKILWDRGYGKPAQSMTLAGDPDAPIAHAELSPEQFAEVVTAARELDDEY